jgi:hypothetical protein
VKRVILPSALLLLAVSPVVAATFVDLGTAAPPSDVGGVPVTAFDLGPQSAIPDLTVVSAIPGAPCGTGDMPVAPDIEKRTVGATWGSWSHGYTGPVFFDATVSAPDPARSNAPDAGSEGEAPVAIIDLTLPCAAAAFYLYVEPNSFGLHDVTVTTDDGTSSGPISVEGNSGANGFAFYADGGPAISSVTVTCAASASGCAIAEFGITESVPTMPHTGLLMLVLLLAVVGALGIRRVRTT